MKTGTRPDIAVTTPNAKLRLSAQDVLADYRLAVRSTAASELSPFGGGAGEVAVWERAFSQLRRGPGRRPARNGQGVSSRALARRLVPRPDVHVRGRSGG